MNYKDSDPFKVVVIRLLVIMLFLQIASLVWVVRRDQRNAIERAARITQFQQYYIASEATSNVPEWIGG